MRTQRTVDNYFGRIAIAVLRPVAMVIGRLLRRDHQLTVGKEVVWVKLLGGGSLIIAMPMLLGFRRAHPKVKMVLITTAAVRPFADLMGVFDEYRVIDVRSSWRILASGLRVLRQTLRADCIVDLEVHSRLTTVFTTLTLARNRVSFWMEDIFWRRGLASHLVFLNRASGVFHFSDRIAELFGVPVATHDECRAALAQAAKVATGHRPSRAGHVCVGFACSDLAHERMLTPSQWVRVFKDNVRPEHHTFLFLGARGDHAKAQEIVDVLRAEFPTLRFENTCGGPTLAESVAMLFDSPEYWGIDSGLLHLARIVGLRCRSYWGPTDPATLLRPDWALDEQVVYRKIACSPCVHTSEEAPCHGDNRCIQGLFNPDAAPVNWTPIELPPRRSTYPDVARRALAGVWRNIGFVCAAIALVWCVVHAFDPPRLNWGDSASDYNAMNAGRNFAKYGFLKLRLTPFVLDPAYMTEADKVLIYTHYPQLPDLMNGVLRVVFRMTDLVQFRLVALCFSFGALFFVYRLISSYWSRGAAQIALALWVINPLWLQHADYLHHAPYAAFFGWGCLYFLIQYFRDERRRGYLAASGVFLFFVFMASYDFWIFIPLLLAMVTVGHYKAVRWPTIRFLSILASCAVAALVFKWGTNAWALGGVQAFIQDLRFQFTERATDTAVRVAYDRGIWPTLLGRVERCFSLLLLPVAAFWLLAPLFKRRWQGRLSGLETLRANPMLLLLAALPFLLVFRELWVGQYYPTLLVLPFYAVACAVLIALLLEAPERWPKLVGGALLGALAWNSIGEDVSFKKAFFDRSAIASLQAEFDSVSQPGQQILVDHVFNAAYRYYFNRNTVELILNPPDHYASALVYYSDPKRARVAPASGAIFVHHKHLTDELYDKGYYYILGRQGLWGPWGNPERYRSDIDGFITRRDSQLVAAVDRIGEKVADTEFYTMWRIKPGRALELSHAETPSPSPQSLSAR